MFHTNIKSDMAKHKTLYYNKQKTIKQSTRSRTIDVVTNYKFNPCNSHFVTSNSENNVFDSKKNVHISVESLKIFTKFYRCLHHCSRLFESG